MPNRLATESSLYLRQHADNPVDWFPWGGEAFAKAGSEQKPVFLSIGYSSCHWCHVMEHESFEDQGTADYLNRHFVCVKVDREERPDVDEAYMGFVQLLTGRGGWPTSVFMTPDRRPFFGGTYWPNQDRHGYSGFRSICERIVQLWNEQRSDLLASADEYAAAIEKTLAGIAPAAGVTVDDALLVAVAEELEMRFDPAYGGFGSAPKFPPHSGIEFLLSFGDRAAPTDAVEMALFTLERMALGGIRDHVGGGFHRYSTDERWLLPHFEKMLYDNALLLGAYARASKLAVGGRAALFGRVVEELIAWATREMQAPEGYFYAALDADSEGEEGRFYVWSYEELLELPGGELLAKSYGALKDGNFAEEASGKHMGLNVLHLSEPADAASRHRLDHLLERRSSRPRPALDDKVLVAWNGLMIAGLAEAGRPDLAASVADAILAAKKGLGELPHMIVGGKSVGSGFLDDYAYLAFGLVKLGRLSEANELMDEAVRLFGGNPGFYGTSEHHETLFGRTKPVLDQPIPSANAVAIRVLVALERFAEAESALAGLGGWIARAPHGAEALSVAALEYLENREPISAQDPIRVEVLFDRSASSLKGMLLLDIPEGWHLKGAGSRLQAICPTSVDVIGGKGSFSYPSDDTYEGQIRIPFSISEISEETEEVELLIGYQACTVSECLPPSSQAIRMRVGSREK